MKLAILTDTNSGISSQEAQERGVFLLDMPLIIDDKVYYQGKNLTDSDFCQALEGDQCVTTCHPSLGDLAKSWEDLFKQGFDQIVYIPMSSALSSSCSSAKLLAESYPGRVHVVDNHRISVTQKASVLKALALAHKNKSGQEIKEDLEKEALRATIYLSVNNLDYLKKGGRVTPAAAAIASVLSIKPILTIQGEKIDSYGRVRGRIQRAQKKMLLAIQKDLEEKFSQESLDDLSLGLTGFGISKDQEEAWLDLAREAFPQVKIHYDPLPASIASHTGPGAFGIGLSLDSI